MIKESLYFIFDGEKSSDFDVVNANIGEGLFDEVFTASRSIRETKVKNNDTPHFEGVDRDPLSFPMILYVEETFDEYDLDRIKEWLIKDDYAPLSFEADLDKVFYVLINDVSNINHNGMGDGYITVNVRCDSPYSYSHRIHTPSNDLFDLTNPLTTNPIIISNNGNMPIMPMIHIEKIGSGDITIENLSNYEKPFKINELLDGEILTIDCLNELIETSLENTYRYDSSNEEYLKLNLGDNRIKVTGSCKIGFEYEFKYL